ncbi:SixA phosphatase family protein [Pendulispora albinea]|uniref:Histidine phosphatase family protein n=1 Tax=Pendulispora albinea TaxID=2741071 RepID=A0ABZ2M1V1_9BACT
MDILLLRTSLTENDALSAPEVPDAHRFLSMEGRQRIRALGSKLRNLEEPTFDRIITSPYPAAVQTAELFADRVDYVGIIEVLPALGSSVPPAVAAPLLLARGASSTAGAAGTLSTGRASIVVVADEPQLSELGAFLIGRPTFPPLLHAQISAIRDRHPAWCLRPGELAKSLLLVA